MPAMRGTCSASSPLPALPIRSRTCSSRASPPPWMKSSCWMQQSRVMSATGRLSGSCARPFRQRSAGGSLKHDISVAVAAIPDFIERGSHWVADNVPDGRLVAYGHVGDGNLHFNLNQAPGADRAAFLGREEAVKRAIHDLVMDFGGSFSAEHGVGRLKVGELERYAPPVELELMRAIKHALDPNGILNPGKVLRPA